MTCELFPATTSWTERHHIFGGRGRRDLSEKYGLVVELDHDVHNETGGAHHSAEVAEQLHKWGQLWAMRKYGWSVEDFRAIFGKNYLSDEELAAGMAPESESDDFTLDPIELPIW